MFRSAQFSLNGNPTSTWRTFWLKSGRRWQVRQTAKLSNLLKVCRARACARARACGDHACDPGSFFSVRIVHTHTCIRTRAHTLCASRCVPAHCVRAQMCTGAHPLITTHVHSQNARSHARAIRALTELYMPTQTLARMRICTHALPCMHAQS